MTPSAEQKARVDKDVEDLGGTLVHCRRGRGVAQPLREMVWRFPEI